MMRRTTIALVSSLLLASTAVSARAQDPVSLGPLGGSAGSVLPYAGDPDTLLLIRYTQGVQLSVDGGASLIPFNGTLSPDVDSLYQDPLDQDTIYAIDGPQVFRSIDFGLNWVPLALVANKDLKHLSVTGTGLLLATDAFNVYRSDDGGSSWSVVHSVVPFAGTVLDGADFAPSDPSIAYLNYNDGILRSEDGGQTWADPGPFEEWVQAMTVSPTDADVLFVGTPFVGVFKSVDGGATFDSITDPVTNGNAEFFRWEPGTGRLWYATLTTLVWSDDQGANWTDATDGWPINTPIPLDLAFASDGTRLLGCEGGGLNDQAGGGLYRMGPSESSWEHYGFLISYINAVAVAGPGGDRVIGIGGGVYSGAPGETLEPTAWHADIGTDTRALAVDPSDPTRWLSGGVGSFFDNAQVIVLTQSGQQFAKVWENYGSGRVEAISFSPFEPTLVLAGLYPAGFGNEAILRSTNGGDTWTEVPGTVGWSTRAITFDPTTPGRVLQLSENNQWSRSLDGGATWLPLQPTWSNAGPGVILQYDLHQTGVVYRGDTGSGLWRSDDGGDTWQSLGVGLHYDSDLEQHPQFPGLLWVSDDDGHVFLSGDRGDSFVTAWDVALDSNAAELALDLADGTLLVGTTSASTWELPAASPFVHLGPGTAGTGGFVPRHHGAGGLPRIGNAGFGFAGDGLVGAGPAALAVGFSGLSLPAVGGTLYSGPPYVFLGAISDGTPGVAGAGSFTIPLAIPNDASIVGGLLYTQFAVLDAGAADPSGFVLSDGLRTRLLP